MCECYKVGGPFIAEDPDCPIHGREAQQREEWAVAERKEEMARYEEIMSTLYNLQQTIERMDARIAELEALLEITDEDWKT